MVQTSRAYSLLGLATAWVLALGLMGSTLHGKWLNFPLSKQLRGAQYSLGAFSMDTIHRVPWSFGCLSAGLIFLAAVAFSLRLWRILSLLGAVLLWVTLFGAFKAALVDARLLQTLGTELTQQQSAFLFTQQAMPVNYGSEPSVWPQVDLSSVEARLMAAWYFVHFGWWAAMVGGSLALGYGAARQRSYGMPVVAGAGAVILLAACSFAPLRAELALMHGRASEAQGDCDAAERSYREAIRLDPWQGLAINTYAALGGLDAARHREGTPEFHIYHAQLASTQSDLPSAVAELHAARTEARGVLGEILRKRESELDTLFARALHSLGAYGASAAASEQALRLDPESLLPAYYLARDAYLVGRYTDAASLSNQLLLKVDDPEIRANLFANIGDCDTQMGDYAAAKVAYRSSYLFDYVLNLRALSALNGPGRDLQ